MGCKANVQHCLNSEGLWAVMAHGALVTVTPHQDTFRRHKALNENECVSISSGSRLLSSVKVDTKAQHIELKSN